MQISKVEKRTPMLINQLLEVWEDSVRETHLFLSDSEIQSIKKYVPQALRDIEKLIAAEENHIPIAFMGIQGRKLEMLFIRSDKRGRGLGRKLLQYGMDIYQINELTVNEQNPAARGFYEHLGFEVVKRTESDEQGNPYPLLYRKRWYLANVKLDMFISILYVNIANLKSVPIEIFAEILNVFMIVRNIRQNSDVFYIYRWRSQRLQSHAPLRRLPACSSVPPAPPHCPARCEPHGSKSKPFSVPSRRLHTKVFHLPDDLHLIVRIDIHPVNQRVSQPSGQATGPNHLPRQLSPGAFRFFVHLHLRGPHLQIGVDFPQPVKLTVNSGFLAFVVLHGDLLQNELFIQHALLVQTALNPLVIFGLPCKLNIQLPGIGEICHIQNDLGLFGENFV